MARLPIVKIGRKKYYADERLRELRNVKDPFDTESIELYYYYKNKKKKKGRFSKYAK